MPVGRKIGSRKARSIFVVRDHLRHKNKGGDCFSLFFKPIILLKDSVRSSHCVRNYLALRERKLHFLERSSGNEAGIHLKQNHFFSPTVSWKTSLERRHQNPFRQIAFGKMMS